MVIGSLTVRRYSLVQSDRGEAGFTAGLSAYEFDLAMEGDATVSDGMGGIRSRSITGSPACWAISSLRSEPLVILIFESRPRSAE